MGERPRQRERERSSEFHDVKEEVNSQSRAAREGREATVDALRRYGVWVVAFFVLLPLPLAALLSLAGVILYFCIRGSSNEGRGPWR